MITTEEKKKGKCLWTPTPKQSEFLSSSFDEVLYGGSAGGGKSDALLIDMLGLDQHSLVWPRYRAILFRKTFPELSELVDRSKEIYPSIFPGAVYNTTDHEWRFPSGAKILFSYMDKDEDRYKHQGNEYQWVGWDELTHWATPVCYRYLQSRTRSTNPDVKCYTRATTNPGGRGHAWVKDHWMIKNDGSPSRFVHVDKFGDKEAKSYRQFIPAKLDDNPYLSQSGYREMLMKLPEKDRKKLLDGRWDVVEGQYFTTWDPHRHIVEPFVIPPDWPRWRGMDWGSTKPYAVGWFTVDPDGVIYLYRELYGWGGEADVGTKESVKQVARKIHHFERHEKAKGIEFRNNPADPSCWYSKGEGITITELFKREGVTWRAAKGGPNSRVNGWWVCNQMLVEATFKVFSTCKHFIRTVPSLQIDETKPEDLETKNQEDHSADMWRYAIQVVHKYQKRVLQKPKAGYMTFDYIINLDEKYEDKSIYRL